MAGAFRRLLTRKVWRSAVSSPKPINPKLHSQSETQYLYNQLPFNHGYRTQQQISHAFKDRIPFFISDSTRSLCIPLLLAGVFGVGILDVAFADTNEVPTRPPLPSEIPSSYDDLEEIAKKERRKLEDLIRSKGMKYGSYPRFTVAVKGQKIAIKFQVPSNCEIPRLIANLASTLNGGSPMEVQSWDSTVAWQLALSLPNVKKESGGSGTGETISNNGDLCVLIFRSLISPDKPEVEFLKKGHFSPAELEALVSIMQIASEKLGQSKTTGKPSTSKSITSLESMGVRVFGLDEPRVTYANEEISWDTIAGYEQQKRSDILNFTENCLVL